MSTETDPLASLTPGAWINPNAVTQDGASRFCRARDGVALCMRGEGHSGAHVCVAAPETRNGPLDEHWRVTAVWR